MSDEELQRLEQRLRTAARAAAPETPSADALGKARDLFRRHRPRPDAPVVRLARLVFDSLRAPAQPLLARGAVEEPRERLYEADALCLRLWQEPGANDSWYLIGQLTDRTEEPVTAAQAFLESDAARFPARPLGQGELHFDAIPAGVYALRLTFDRDAPIVVDTVSVGLE